MKTVPTGDSPGKREAVRGMFSEITPGYDRLNRLLSAGQDLRWRRKAVRLFSPEVQKVLDVAAGTGDLSLALIRERPDVRIFATDFVRKMCEKGQSKLSGDKSLMAFAVADALKLPLHDQSFDACMAAFGVRNFENLGAGLQEMCRILRPGGEILVLEFFPSRNAFIEKIFRFYFQHILPRIGALVSGKSEAYRYLPRSVGDFVDRETFAELLRKTGFVEIRNHEFSGGIATAFHARRGG
ncbi:MAG: ubiquinone/menaquinone biosynthesis methyltransferase [Candidatus Krumholzibacteria bacterium]|nr:ubiquinone/menaquinone biosynthesis methyltransferase [Candidatus Krumholzibacteria bacterium]MDP6668543.1 ubiquinone/menaquinone biosynthesis methyltransferase [Candidatus Krumholzibacteria bacterium]MDP6797129.1 ubiquinone/menaquinone biosynthesis methyltransferase [Candidatus Krumholzibacteria bacterium]MDP7021795.1 ubiquinone/menaquinone biosynthesis methyltransferase [Candidatus Krumholzibacteria bacterium]